MVWRIGSAPDCQVRMSQTGVSGLHATLANDGGAWSVSDEISVNGVYVNGTKRLTALLDSGDVIQIAGSRLLIHLPQESRRIASARPSWLVTGIAFVVTCTVFALIWWWWKH